MGLFDRFKAGLKKTQDKLVHELKRIVTRSPRLTADSIEELEAALLGADLGTAMTAQIIAAARKSFESQGREGLDFIVFDDVADPHWGNTSRNITHSECTTYQYDRPQ